MSNNILAPAHARVSLLAAQTLSHLLLQSRTGRNGAATQWKRLLDEAVKLVRFHGLPSSSESALVQKLTKRLTNHPRSRPFQVYFPVAHFCSQVASGLNKCRLMALETLMLPGESKQASAATSVSFAAPAIVSH